MFTREIFLILLSLSITGCVTVVEYDAEKMEYEQVNKLKYAQQHPDPFNNPATPPLVKIADNDDVYVEAIKLKPVEGPQHIKLDVWTIKATNRSKITKCVAIKWKLQDFEFTSDLPLEFLLQGREQIKIGDMKQSIWSFDSTLIAIPPSGYVDSMNVRDADIEKTTGKYTCDQLEEDIQEPKESEDDHD